MRQLIILILLVNFSCSEKPAGTELFEHELLSLEYPKSWSKSSEEGLILAISKYSQLEVLKEEENPNIVVVAQDSLSLLGYDLNSFEDFLLGFKQNQLSKSNIKLEEDFKQVNVNGNNLTSIKYKVETDNLTVLQTQYFYKCLGYYVSIILTHEYGRPSSELTTILNTLKIPEYQTLDELL